ncbi:MAG TPA: hypothetical protein VIC08_14980, partial [Cellvibrionaceae bacterium]
MRLLNTQGQTLFFIGCFLVLSSLASAQGNFLEITFPDPDFTNNQQAEYSIEGSAFAINSPDQLLYIERYTEVDSNNRVLVDYFTPDNNRFAQKVLDYTSGLTTPSYHLRDTRDNSENGARVGNESILLLNGIDGEIKQKKISLKDQQVVDAGFASAVRNHWKALQLGDKVDINFAFATQQRNVKLTLQGVEGSQTPAYQGDADWHYFTLTVSNRLLAMFVDSIYLAFDSEQKLMRYY